MQVIHTVGSLSIHAGGPSFTVPRLCENFKSIGPEHDICIITGKGDGKSINRAVDGVAVHSVSERRLNYELERVLREKDAAKPVILHDHGLWLRINRACASVSRCRRVPRVISPRGMLSPWALSHRRYKKLIAWWLYAARDLKGAQLLHATSELEANELRALGAKQPIAVIPNGVDPFTTSAVDSRGTKRPYVLFLSRIHRKKGVAELLRAWQSLPATDWELVFAGFDEEGIFSGKSLPPNVRYIGHVEGTEKNLLLQQASLFVLPSYSENFGVVVAESLIAGVPVITTHGTPWESLETEQCGWWIPMNEKSVREALAKAMALPASELQRMGNLGREYAVRTFGWGEIARKMTVVYEWILGGGPPPDWIRLE